MRIVNVINLGVSLVGFNERLACVCVCVCVARGFYDEREVQSLAATKNLIITPGQVMRLGSLFIIATCVANKNGNK